MAEIWTPNLVGDQPISMHSCLVCGIDTRNGAKTDEHVFPKWLQERFNLWDKTIGLLNGTHLSYKQLRVPCCSECNSEHLSKIESRVASATLNGFNAVAALPTGLLTQWLAKLFLGIMRRETSLPTERRKGNSAPIVSASYIRRRFSAIAFWLSTVRGEFSNVVAPMSVIVRRCQVPSRIEGQFDFMDDIECGGVAIRMRDVGILCHFLDMRVHDAHLAREFDELYPSSLPLHPTQFRELAARFFYKATLLQMQVGIHAQVDRWGNEYLVLSRDEPLAGRSLWAEWSPIAYARKLACLWDIQIPRIYRYPDQVATSLVTPEGRYFEWDVDSDVMLDFLIDRMLERQRGVDLAVIPPPGVSEPILYA